MASKKMVYFFGNGKSEGAKETKALLGGKGLGLAQMTESKVPVPAGFTITTEVCDYYSKNKSYPKDLKKLVDDNIKKLEKAMNIAEKEERKLGREFDKLLGVRRWTNAENAHTGKCAT